MKLKKEFKIYPSKAAGFFKNKRNLKILGLGIFLAISIGIIGFLNYYNTPLMVGFIADIHAGDQKYRQEDEKNVIIPIDFEINLTKALREMGKVDLIIALGDNLNRPSRKNTKKLLEITKGYPMVWVKGNHDKLLHFNELLSKERYYYIDKKKWRIIVLDNSATYPDTTGIDDHGRGFIDQEQLNWLKEKLKTDKKIIIAMHIPMFVPGNPGTIRKDYAYLEEIFVQSGNVKHIFSGHWHTYDNEIEKDGIVHHLIPSVSLEGGQGLYYKIEL
ncbi:MAG: hypothetical protein UR66_C0005G0002 [Candidatus Moranbacteria bacterium GW2011_GWE1_35_17]|nr:MAG: hypothetical protein UR66_C0005G0002 [Candidatus Moranbacteria bacterium GW2011_GWE1_35_17]KKP81566.1 MAG: hypothetical protein UR82_C0057G0002 [Candidatus Moranbacteria bacterium GW2011_GWF1_35_5]